MMTTSKSTLTVARMALRAAQEGLPDYAHRKSPRKFTQPQLLASLVVKAFLGFDYRGIHILFHEWRELRDILGLDIVPHFTTLCAASRRLLNQKHADRMFHVILNHCRQQKLLSQKTSLAAIDSTGLESRHVSVYYTKRCFRHAGHYKHRYPKLTAICDTKNHVILGTTIDRGPRVDHVEAISTLHTALQQQSFSTLLGDAGYESETFHRLCREELGIKSIIPTTRRGRSRHDGKPKALRGKWRRRLHKHFPKKTYGQRWQIETVFSMLKRNLGAALQARSYHSQNREIRLRIMTHNLMIL